LNTGSGEAHTEANLYKQGLSATPLDIYIESLKQMVHYNGK